MKFTSDLQVTNRNVFQLVFAASLLALALSAAIVPANAQSSTYADNFDNSASIEGSWIFNIDVLARPTACCDFQFTDLFRWRRNSCDNPFSTSYGDLLRRMEVQEVGQLHLSLLCLCY